MRSSCVPQSSVGSIDRPAKNLLHLLGVVLVYWFLINSDFKCVPEIKVTKGRALLLKLLMHGEDGADKIPDQTPLALAQSCSGHGEFSPSK